MNSIDISAHYFIHASAIAGTRRLHDALHKAGYGEAVGIQEPPFVQCSSEGAAWWMEGFS
jgi:hypothetical protein